MSKEKNFDFDPEFSEYNPIMEELSAIKDAVTKREDENFISSLIKKITSSAAILQIR